MNSFNELDIIKVPIESKDALPVTASTAQPLVTALVRGLNILRCFDRPGIELTVTEIARQVKLSQPTAWRLCATLIDCGYLVRGTSGSALRIGAPALTLGYVAARGLGPAELARPYLRRLTERTRGNATLSVRDGIEIIAVEHSDGEHILPNQPVGWRAPLTAIPSGLAVLAALAPDALEASMAQLERSDSAWKRHRRRIMTARAQYEQEGFVTLTGMLDGQYSAAATPLFTAGNTGQQWTLSIGGAASRWSEEHLANAARELLEIAALLRPALAVA